jgi:hypothetical protein
MCSSRHACILSAAVKTEDGGGLSFGVLVVEITIVGDGNFGRDHEMAVK